jgi:hypothetical protein
VAPTLFTAAWSTLHMADQAGVLWAVPVRTSRGLPRFWPEAEAFPALELLMPEGWHFGVWAKDRDKGDRCYRRKLHIAGLELVSRRLHQIAADCGGPLALACFENLPADCHRGQFALWWQRKTGERVPELSLMQSFYGASALVWEVSP